MKRGAAAKRDRQVGDGEEDEREVDDTTRSGKKKAVEEAHPLPQGVPQWVLTRPKIPSLNMMKKDNDYEKGRRIDADDVTPSLQRELAGLREWWTKTLNLERPGGSVGKTTCDGHEARLKCFLGFVWRYNCVQHSKDSQRLVKEEAHK